MNLSAVSRSSYGAVDSSNAPDPYALRNDASATPFASMLAGAMEHRAPELVSHAAPHSTSELDAPDESDDSSTEVSGSSRDDGTRRSSAADDAAAAARLGAAAAGLDPSFRAKLARVAERMKNETGKTVTVNEGVRSQDRQNALFAQGRTTDGPVVTWTRNSMHLKGLAADLVVDGGFTDQAGFAKLREIAEQEGLHTLGAMDPGHIEMRGAAGSTALDSLSALARDKGAMSLPDSIGTAASQLKTALASRPAALASVAQVARVALPAQTARVASVAQVATGAAAVNAKQAGGNDAANGNSNGSRDSRDKQGVTITKPVFERIMSGDNVGSERAYGALAGGGVAGTADGSAPVVGIDPSRAAAHVDRVLDLQDAQGSRSISRLALSLDDGNGGQDVVRIGMRGTSVGASFDMGNAAGADRISSRLGELTRALEKQGLEPQAFQVRSAATTDADGAAVKVANVVQRATTDGAAARNDTQTGERGQGRHAFSRNDSQDTARERSESRRRRDTIFSLTNEAS